MNKMQDHIDRIVKNSSQEPGVYTMHAEDGTILYIGKAKRLRSRLQSYFRVSSKLGPRKQKLVEQVHDISYTVTNSELEALILETNLIKEHRPKYNVLMKDDKNYVYVRVSVQDPYPRISLTRTRRNDGAKYFGPKTADWKAKSQLQLLKRIFPYRHCRLTIEPDPRAAEKVHVGNKVIKYPCLDYHIKRCFGPCIGAITPEDYAKNIEVIMAYLAGDTSLVESRLKADMAQLVAAKDFERAAVVRDQMQILLQAEQKQVVSDPKFFDLDVINIVAEQDAYFLAIFKVRAGKLASQETATFRDENVAEETESTVLSSFLQQYYTADTEIPRTILIPFLPEQSELIEGYLQALSTHKVRFKVPAQGHKNELLTLALKNAKSHARQMRVKWLSEEKYDPQNMITKLKETLQLKRLPKRIECYDISHLGGTNTVGSMVVFEKGINKNKDYRHFQIKHLPIKGEAARPDDFASMEEVLSRRLKYLAKLPEGVRIAPATQKQFIELFGGTPNIPAENSTENSTTQALLEVTSEVSREQCLVITKKDSKGKTQILLKVTVGLSGTTNQTGTFSYEIVTKQTKLDPILLPLLRYLFKKYKLTKLRTPADLFTQLKVTPIDLGMQEDRRDASILVLEKHRFSGDDPSLSKKPDLIVIDGGKGQLSSALAAFKKFSVTGVEIISLAKKKEEVYKPGEKFSFILPDGTPEKYLLQQVRDEAHRFAISHNRNKRLKQFTESQLDAIPGVGPTLKKRLLQTFGSITGIAEATEEQLQKLTTKTVASRIYTLLNAAKSIQN